MTESGSQFEEISSIVRKTLKDFYANKIVEMHFTRIGDSEGVYSYVAILKIKLSTGDEKELIVKIPTIEKYVANRLRRNWTAGSSNSFIERLKELHNKEICFYDNIQSNTVIPKVILKKPLTDESCGLLVMERIPNAKCIPIYENFSEAQLFQIVDAYVDLQSAANTAELKLLDTGLLEGVLDSTLSKDNVQKRLGIIGTSFPVISEQINQLASRYDSVYANDLLMKERKRWNLLLHGDLHNTNILLQEGNFASFIDFQTAHFGNPCEDLIRLLCIGGAPLSNENLQQSLLSYYCQQLNLKSLANIREEQLASSFTKMFPLCGMWALLSLHASFDHHLNEAASDLETDAVVEKFTKKMSSIASKIIHMLQTCQ